MTFDFTAAPLALSPEQKTRARLLLGVVLAVLEEGNIAGFWSWIAHAGLKVIVLSAVESACFLAFPAAFGALLLSWLFCAEGTKILFRAVRTGLSGGEPSLEDAAVLLYAIVVCTGVGVSWRFGFRVYDHEGARVATLVSVVSVIVFTFGGAMAVALLLRRVGRWANRFARPERAFAWLPLADLELAAVGSVTAMVLLPRIYGNSPSAFFLGAALGPTLASRVRALRKCVSVPSWLWLTVALSLTAFAGLALRSSPSLVQLAVLARSPYTSIVITTLRGAVDRDHDGYSPILGGGDCEDRDEAIHPNAIDVPDNGIDENCSGVDAHRFVPPAMPEPSERNGSPRRFNVLLIHVDALRPDHVGFAGYTRPTTPRIDRFRQEATWFKNAYTPAPSTRFALSALMTGLPIERIPHVRGGDHAFALRSDAVTFAERLEPLGYDRVGYTLSYVLDHIQDVGQGFRVWEPPWPRQEWESVHTDSARLTTDAALKYLGTRPQDGTTPYLLFLHYDCTHDPYVKHAPWNYGDRDVDRYDSALNYCDDQLGRLFDALEKQRDRDYTAVFLYSDHGELFGEHGFENHGSTLYQPDIRALLLVKIPGGTVSRVDTPMDITDIYPTILDLAGLPPDSKSQAYDLYPYVVLGQPMPARPLFFYTDLMKFSVHFESRAMLDRGGRLKLIRNVSVGITELYDIESDPGELRNLAEERPAVRDSLLSMLEGWEFFEKTGLTHRPR